MFSPDAASFSLQRLRFLVFSCDNKFHCKTTFWDTGFNLLRAAKGRMFERQKMAAALWVDSFWKAGRILGAMPGKRKSGSKPDDGGKAKKVALDEKVLNEQPYIPLVVEWFIG